MESVRKLCRMYNIKFTRYVQGPFSEFDLQLNYNIPEIYVHTALEFISYCISLNVEISEVQVLLGGFKFLFKDSKGDAIIHKFSCDADIGQLETMHFEFDGDGVSTHDALTLAKMIASELEGIEGFYR